jgi:hypothetical protein
MHIYADLLTNLCASETTDATYAEFEHFASRMIAASALKGAQQALSYLPTTPNSRRAEFERDVCIQFCNASPNAHHPAILHDRSSAF